VTASHDATSKLVMRVRFPSPALHLTPVPGVISMA
jgi:hypothetical protein